MKKNALRLKNIPYFSFFQSIVFFVVFSACSHKSHEANPHFKHRQSFLRNPDEVEAAIRDYDYDNRNGNIQYSLYLIGDSGEPANIPQLAPALADEAKDLAYPSSVVFLGDNVYENGLPNQRKKDYEETLEKLTVQLDAFGGYDGTAYIIPGNHDYHKINKFIGRKRVKNQAAAVAHYDNAYFTPQIDSRKAVELIELDYGDKKIGLVVLDIEWYLYHGYWFHIGWQIKKKRFWRPLEAILYKSDFDHWVIATHHPMYSISKHGVEKSFYSKVDIQKSKYGKLIKRLNQRFDEAGLDRIIYSAGHDHTLQLFVHDNIYHILSGSGSKKTFFLEEDLSSEEVAAYAVDPNYLANKGIRQPQAYADAIRFADNSWGYARVDFHADGSAWVTFLGFPDSDEAEKLYVGKLYGAGQDR